jgi:DNA-binding response OmpR family regulator
MDTPSSKSVLIVEDERDVVDLLTLNLRKAGGFIISTANDGASGLNKARTEKPALIILDLMLPKMTGLEVCKVLKTDPATRHIPIMMLTAKAEEIDRIVGLEFGADDYVTKPFSPRELVLRVASVLRRSRTASPLPAELSGNPTKLVDGPLRVDVAAHEVEFGGQPLMLTVREFDLLAYLMGHARQTFSRDELMRDVWGWSFGDQSTVTVHVRRLRQKLEAASGGTWSPIATVWGVGYRYDPSTVAAVG